MRGETREGRAIALFSGTLVLLCFSLGLWFGVNSKHVRSPLVFFWGKPHVKTTNLQDELFIEQIWIVKNTLLFFADFVIIIDKINLCSFPSGFLNMISSETKRRKRKRKNTKTEATGCCFLKLVLKHQGNPIRKSNATESVLIGLE